MNEIMRVNSLEDDARLPAANDPTASLAVALARVEIDQQIATARAFPRSIKRVLTNIQSLATLDDETAEECIYALPRGGKPIRGPSIRFAEIVFSQWGNARVSSRLVHIDRFEKTVTVEAMFHDLESNAMSVERVERRISGRDGKIYSDDMIIVTANAARAIAKRNAILSGVPKAFTRKLIREIEGVIAGDVKTLAERREKALKAFAHYGVTPERVFAALEVKGIEDINLDHITTLAAMHSSIKNNEATVEELFPVKVEEKAATGSRSSKSKLDDLAGVDPETEEIKNTAAASTQSQAGTVAQSGSAAGEGAGSATSSQAGPATETNARSGGKGKADKAAKADQGAPAADQGETESRPPTAAETGGSKTSEKAAASTSKTASGSTLSADDESLLADLLTTARNSAAQGRDALDEFEEGLNAHEAQLMGPHMGDLKKAAKKADQERG